MFPEDDWGLLTSGDLAADLEAIHYIAGICLSGLDLEHVKHILLKTYPFM